MGRAPAVFCLCHNALAMLVLGELVFQTGADDLNTYLYYVISTAWAGVLVMAYLHEAAILHHHLRHHRRGPPQSDPPEVRGLPGDRGVGIAMTMWLIQELNYQADLQMVVAAVIVGFTFAVFCLPVKDCGSLGTFLFRAGRIVLLVFAGPRWFMIMLVFFILGSAATQVQIRVYKKRIGVEQGQSGARGYRNVFANGIVATAAAVLFGVFQRTGLYRHVCRQRCYSCSRYAGKRDRRNRRDPLHDHHLKKSPNRTQTVV